MGEPPPVPLELLLDALLLDALLLLDAELLLDDAELLDEAELLAEELLDAELLDALLVPVPAPPAPPPPVLLVDVLVSPPAPLVVADVEFGDEDSSALDAPPVPSSVPAAQLAGAVATRTEPAARRREKQPAGRRLRGLTRRGIAATWLELLSREPRARLLCGLLAKPPALGVAFGRARP